MGLSSLMVWAWMCPYSTALVLCLKLTITMTSILLYATLQMIRKQTYNTIDDTLVGRLGHYVGARNCVIVVGALWLYSGLHTLIFVCVDDRIHALMIH